MNKPTIRSRLQEHGPLAANLIGLLLVLGLFVFYMSAAGRTQRHNDAREWWRAAREELALLRGYRDTVRNYPGYNLAVLDPGTPQLVAPRLVASEWFNTTNRPAEVGRLTQFVASIKSGHVVALSAFGDPSANVDASLVEALRSLGISSDPRHLAQRGLVAVGVKDATPGSALHYTGTVHLHVGLRRGSPIGTTGIRAPCDMRLVATGAGSSRVAGRILVRDSQLTGGARDALPPRPDCAIYSLEGARIAFREPDRLFVLSGWPQTRPDGAWRMTTTALMLAGCLQSPGAHNVRVTLPAEPMIQSATLHVHNTSLNGLVRYGLQDQIVDFTLPEAVVRPGQTQIYRLAFAVMPDESETAPALFEIAFDPVP